MQGNLKTVLSNMINIYNNPATSKDEEYSRVHYSHDHIKEIIMKIMKECYQQRKDLSTVALYHRYHIREADTIHPAELYRLTISYFDNLKLTTMEQDRNNNIERRTLNQTTFYNMCRELKHEGKLNSEEIRVRKNRFRVVYRLLDTTNL